MKPITAAMAVLYTAIGIFFIAVGMTLTADAWAGDSAWAFKAIGLLAAIGAAVYVLIGLYLVRMTRKKEEGRSPS